MTRSAVDQTAEGAARRAEMLGNWKVVAKPTREKPRSLVQVPAEGGPCAGRAAAPAGPRPAHARLAPASKA